MNDARYWLELADSKGDLAVRLVGRTSDTRSPVVVGAYFTLLQLIENPALSFAKAVVELDRELVAWTQRDQSLLEPITEP